MQAKPKSESWYRYPIMWLVVAPPIGSVIAGVITMILILQHPDRDIRIPHVETAIAHGHAVNSVEPPAE